MHSDRGDQSDRGLRRLWNSSQTRRGRPVARQQRSEVVAIAHARQAGEDVAQVGERVFAVALTRDDDRVEDGGALAGVTGVLSNPKLTLYRDSAVVGINDNWSDVGAAATSSTASAVGAFALPANSLDAAILATLAPGFYTAQIVGADTASTAGIALVEIYEVP